MRDEVEGEENDTGRALQRGRRAHRALQLRAERANDGFLTRTAILCGRRGDAEPDAGLASMDEAAEEAAVERGVGAVSKHGSRMGTTRFYESLLS